MPHNGTRSLEELRRAALTAAAGRRRSATVGRVALPVLLLLASPSAASAPSFFLHSAHLVADGVPVGECAGAPVSADPARGTNAHVHYDGAKITIDAEVDLLTSRMQVGVGADTPLGGAFSPRMRRGTWAPVLAMAGNEISVALPPGAPAHAATLARGAPRVRGTPRGSPWSVSPAHERDDARLHCDHFTLTAEPAAGLTWEVPMVAARRRVQTRAGIDTIEVSFSGFLFTGYRRHDAPCPAEGEMLGHLNLGSGAGDGLGNGRVVVLPAGTPLFSSATAAAPFATLRTVAYGIELREDGAGPPHGPARWTVDLHDPHGGTFLLSAWTHLAAETLADAPPENNGFGMVRADLREWPTSR